MTGNAIEPNLPAERRISVLIASVGRPALLRTLASVDAVEVPEGYAVEIVVVDDSTDFRVKPLLADRKWRLPLRVVEIGSRNVSHARNALLDEAGGEWGLFVDDDEHVEAGWVADHLRAATDFEADAVFGPVGFIYPETTPQWFRDARFMWKGVDARDNGRLIATGATCNTLVRLSTVRRMGLRFDPAFGRSGGEDEEFFCRMAKAGGRLVLTDRARVWEEVPEARATAAYVLERAERTGASFARRTLAGRSTAGRWTFTVNALAKLAIAGSAAIAAWPFDHVWRYRFQAMARSNIGKLKTVFGREEMDGWAREIR